MKHFMLLLFIVLSCSHGDALKAAVTGSAGVDSALQLFNEMDSCHANASCSHDSDCPVWYFCDEKNSTCECGPAVNGIIQCDPVQQVASVLNCYCVTFQEGSNETIAGACFINCGYTLHFKDSVYNKLEKNRSQQNNKMCGYMDRAGDLCGECEDSYYRMAYSYYPSCITCKGGHKNWLLYIIAAYGSLTFFYFFVLFLKLNVTSSHLHGFVLISQALSIPDSVRLFLNSTKANNQMEEAVKAVSAIFGIWNLDFFRAYTTGICLKLGTLSILALDYTIALYPLLLTIVSYMLISLHDRNFRLVVLVWKPFRYVLMLFRRNWDSRTSIVDAYSTFFILSYIKLLNVSFELLTPTLVHTLGLSKIRVALYYDATKQFFGKDHLPFAILALVFSFVFTISPMIVLFLYQFNWFLKLLHCLPIKHHILHTFIDSFQGCYKDGTEPGTRDYRWFSAMYLLIRLVCFLIFAITPTAMYFVFATIALLIFAMVIVIVQPYKSNVAHYTPINVAFIILLALFYTSIAGINIAVVKNQDFFKACIFLTVIFACIPLLYICVCVIQWLFTRRKFGLEIVARIRLLRKGYEWWADEDLSGDSLPDRMANPHQYHNRNLTSFGSNPSC